MREEKKFGCSGATPVLHPYNRRRRRCERWILISCQARRMSAKCNERGRGAVLRHCTLCRRSVRVRGACTPRLSCLNTSEVLAVTVSLLAPSVLRAQHAESPIADVHVSRVECITHEQSRHQGRTATFTVGLGILGTERDNGKWEGRAVDC